MITVKTKNCLKRFKDDIQNDIIISESDEQRLAKIGLWSIEDRHVRADHVEVYTQLFMACQLLVSTCFLNITTTIVQEVTL